ncbi:unnamed protein product, partial [Porites evermanni]
SFKGSLSFIDGWCPGVQAPVFNQTNPFATAPIMNLSDSSFTISCWIKQTTWIINTFGAIYGDWNTPRQFLLGTMNQRIVFYRHSYSNVSEEWWSLQSTNVSLSNWTHLAVTWNHLTGAVLIYINGKIVGTKSYPPEKKFYGPSGKPYTIGNAGHEDAYQFNGSVVLLSVLNWALSIDDVDDLRGLYRIIKKNVLAGGSVLVKWNPILRKACPFVHVYYREQGESKWNSVSVTLQQRALFYSHTLYLECLRKYQIVVSSYAAFEERDLRDKQMWTVSTGEDGMCCDEEEWEVNLTRQGWILNCSRTGRYLFGILRKSKGPKGGIDLLTKGKCCTPPLVYRDEVPVCIEVLWNVSLNRSESLIEQDFFYLNLSKNSLLLFSLSLSSLFCCRPRNFKNAHLDCHGKKRISLQSQRWDTCEAWSYLVGFYGVLCEGSACVEKLRCCRMPPPEMLILGHWLLDGKDQDITFSKSLKFVKGWCSGSTAPNFVQNSFATAPAVHLNGRSFTICCWIKQTRLLFGEQTIYNDWHDPWQFQLTIIGDQLRFARHSHGITEWWYFRSTKLSFNTWTHIAVTWNHVTGNVYLYASGIIVGSRSFTPGTKFYTLTGNPYKIANDGHWNDHQFYGSVMDLYVFGTALSRDQIAKVRGVPIILNKDKEVAGETVVIIWEPPLNGACSVLRYKVYYRKVSSAETSPWSFVTVDKNCTNHTLHLGCWKEYEVAVTSLSAANANTDSTESSFSDSRKWNFRVRRGKFGYNS